MIRSDHKGMVCLFKKYKIYEFRGKIIISF